MLVLASILLIFCGVAHSYLGERLILSRLFRRDNLPHIYGSDAFTKGTLRFTWHITSFAWFGFSALLYLIKQPSAVLLYTVSLVFLISACFSIYFTKGKHFSWVLFLAISGLTFMSTLNG